MTDKGFSFGGPSGPVLFKDRITCPHCKKEVVNKERRTARGGYPANCPHCGAELFSGWWFENEQKKVFLDSVQASESNRRGTLEFEAGNFQEAIKYYEEAISLSPDDAGSWYNKGAALHKLNRQEDAIECYDKAIAAKSFLSSAGDPWRGKGVSLYLLGQKEEGIRCLDKAISINAGDGGAWLVKGIALCDLGRAKEGIKCLRKADSLGEASAKGTLALFGAKPRWKFWQRR